MKKLLFLILWLPFIGMAQTYQYIGVKDGLSNRRVYSIQKDQKGFMWFLTHEGVDRYDGKEFTRYKLTDNGIEVNSMLNLNWLYTDNKGVLWEIGKRGKIFRYNDQNDRFELVYKLPIEKRNDRPTSVSFAWIDHNQTIWLCNDQTIYLYHTADGTIKEIINKTGSAVNSIEQTDSIHFFIGTDKGIQYARMEKDGLHIISNEKLDELKVQVSDIYFSPTTHKLFLGTFRQGIIVYDLETHSIYAPQKNLKDINISCMRPLNKEELLIATDGAGVYKMNTYTNQITSYINADYNSNNGMNGNTINDLYIDEEERIWMANYPIGITVRNNRYSKYTWFKHAIGNTQSLIDDQVNSVIEDSDGDLWFATNNGISHHNTRTGKWHSYLSSFENDNTFQSHIFITLCEVAPGIIWVGGYSSGIYQIDKRTSSVTSFTPATYAQGYMRPDKYIRDIYKDSQGYVWSGGYYNLKRIDQKAQNIRLYPGLNSITAIIEKDKHTLWIGSATGLYQLNKESGKFTPIKMPVESIYIYSLYHDDAGTLYIGTSGSGLLLYTPNEKRFVHYHADNCALISNNIYTILSNRKGNILITTESGVTSFSPQDKRFKNWTSEMGLMTTHFNAQAGILRQNGNFVLGSSDGAVEFSKYMKLPESYANKMYFSNFRLFYQPMYPNSKESPLTEPIDDTHQLSLKHNQNNFSLKVSSINYDYPSNILYSWKLEGFYDEWSKPSTENTIRYTNIPSGEYTLRIRAISNEEKQIIIEERHIDISIARPYWRSVWAILFYALFTVAIAIISLRIFFMRKQRKISDEKIRFFINTAHDIRTPLTLIKAPLEDLREEEALSQNGVDNMNTALRNVNTLLRLTTNLINFERTDIYSSQLNLSEYELNAFIEDTVNAFRTYANARHIQLSYTSNFDYANVWFDKEKMESIFKNIISNALKYTATGGTVQVCARTGEDTWSIEVKDTGIGIPIDEQKKLFRFHFRGSNAINSKMTGSGIGLLLVGKLVRLHKGKIQMSSIENQGTNIKITFRKGNKHFKNAHFVSPSNLIRPGEMSLSNASALSTDTLKQSGQTEKNETGKKLLIVEDNDELRKYLSQALSEQYATQTCANGKEALDIIPEYQPDMVISDIMMPEMKGDELCKILKNDINTSHIPIILLTALSDEKDILSGLNIGADEYIAKPFNIGILKATINGLLLNRERLRRKYSSLESNNDENTLNGMNYAQDIDWKFITTVKKSVKDNITNQDFNVDRLAEMMGMSRTSFYNKLKALTAQTPSDYIRLIRLKYATTLLEENKYNITEISEMTGFSDAKYFREVFKKHYNVSPSQYLKEKRKEKGEKEE